MKSKKLILAWVFSLLTVMAFTVPSDAGTGDLQVYSEQGFEIYIDDVLAGTTNGFDRGLFVEGLESGSHTLRAEKAGFEPVLKKFNITGYRSWVITIDPDEVRQTGDREESTLPAGAFGLRSAPMGAAVYIDGVYKGQTDLLVEGVRTGNRKVRFERDGSVVEGEFSVTQEETLKLKAHFREMTIINISTLEQEGMGREAEDAAFNEAVRAGSGNDVDAAVIAWSRFVEKYPGGVHAQDAKGRLALWEERKEKNLFFFEGEWIAADAAADRLEEHKEDWIQLDIGISLDDLAVAYVTPGSPAGKAGIVAGDMILEVDKKRMKKVSDVQKSLKKGKKEKSRLILLKRSSRTVFVEVVY